MHFCLWWLKSLRRTNVFKHIKQLIEFETGMSTRIGYPNEHLANKTEKLLMSPMYATAIGLLIKGLESTGSQNMATDPDAIPVPEEKPEPIATATAEETQAEKEEQAAEESSVPTGLKGPNFLEKWFNNLKEFLNNDIED